MSTTRGTITSDPAGISCPSNCAEDYEYDDFCTDLPGRDECELGTPTNVTLTASGGGAGYGPHWSGCDSAAGSTCGITMEGAQNVSVSWTDDANPTVGLLSPPAKAGPSTVFNATASDNSGTVNKVDFYVDGVLRATDTSAPFQYHPGPEPVRRRQHRPRPEGDLPRRLGPRVERPGERAVGRPSASTSRPD